MVEANRGQFCNKHGYIDAVVRNTEWTRDLTNPTDAEIERSKAILQEYMIPIPLISAANSGQY